MNSEITSAYSKLESMHEFWYGKRYNELLTKFNKINPQLNTMLELVVRKLPYVLELIANNYSNDSKIKKRVEYVLLIRLTINCQSYYQLIIKLWQYSFYSS